LKAEDGRIKTLLDLLSSLLGHGRAFRGIYLKPVANTAFEETPQW